MTPYTSPIVGTTTSEASDPIAGSYGRGGGAHGEPLSLDRQNQRSLDMTSRSSGPAPRPVAIALCLMLACVAVAVLAAATAHASEYKMVACAANNGAPPYSLATNSGIFVFENHCDGARRSPAGNDAFMRIAENQPSGHAAYGAYLAVNFTPPGWIVFRAAGGYTREPSAFNDGWQARFCLPTTSGAAQLQMAQGEGLGRRPRYFGTSSVFTSHLWPWPTGTTSTAGSSR